MPREERASLINRFEPPVELMRAALVNDPPPVGV
jgi:hypothetical protein